jgi:hypothetical protein
MEQEPREEARNWVGIDSTVDSTFASQVNSRKVTPIRLTSRIQIP